MNRFRILVADDDPLFNELARTCLSSAGHTVDIVTDGSDALETLIEGDYNLALIDLSMPKIDGFRLISFARHTSKLAKLPILVISARADADAIDEARRLGATSYLTKPIDWRRLPQDVISVVNSNAWTILGA